MLRARQQEAETPTEEIVISRLGRSEHQGDSERNESYSKGDSKDGGAEDKDGPYDARVTEAPDHDIEGAPQASLHGGAEFNEPHELHKPATSFDVITNTIHLEDDPSLSAMTFRTIFLGVGLSVFAGTLSSIYYFKPQSVVIPTVFLAVLAFVFGEAMARLIPRKGAIGRFFNPGPFNQKEHLAITIMANAASVGALGIQIVGAERLFFNRRQSDAVYIFLLLSSQMLGYGIAGLMRKVLVYPTVMLWPGNIPISNMIESLHRKSPETRKTMRVFWYVFGGIFIWELFPQWIMPLLTGISVFCLAKRDSPVFTNIFGGAEGNEGLGLFSICLDWQYISGGVSPLYFPLSTLISQGLGVCGCMILFASIYYANVWDALNYPFLGQEIFSVDSNATNPIQWNQTAAIGADNRILPDAIEQVGLPQFSSSNVLNILISNMVFTAALVHLALWHRKEIAFAFDFLRPSTIKRGITRLPSLFAGIRHPFNREQAEPEPVPLHYDPHYTLVAQNYKACPNWWYAITLVASFVVGIVVCYKADSGVPVWAFIVACVLGYVFLIALGSLQAITGVSFVIQSPVQMISGYLQPGRPISNMYFALYGYNSLVQGVYLAQDLKLGQYGHLAPRVTFFAQMLGTFVGVILNYYISNEIITNQAAILISVEGTNIWSGNQIQQPFGQAVAFGGFPHELFSIGGQYQWVSLATLLGFVCPIPFWLLHRKYPKLGMQHINTPVILYFFIYLNVGINSSIMTFFLFGFLSQWYVRRRYPNIFVRYNYLVSAALDGGTSTMVFILSFAVLGAAGAAVAFPTYWGNPDTSQGINIDYCYSG